MSNDNDKGDSTFFLAGAVLAVIAIGIGVIIGEASSCSTRQSVRHECDTYGKTELDNQGATGKLTYTCAKAENQPKAREE